MKMNAAFIYTEINSNKTLWLVEHIEETPTSKKNITPYILSSVFQEKSNGNFHSN